jgi:hypothetical protein
MYTRFRDRGDLGGMIIRSSGYWLYTLGQALGRRYRIGCRIGKERRVFDRCVSVKVGNIHRSGFGECCRQVLDSKSISERW